MMRRNDIDMLVKWYYDIGVDFAAPHDKAAIEQGGNSMNRKLCALVLALAMCASFAIGAVPASASEVIKIAVGTDRINWLQSQLEAFKAENPDTDIQIIEIVNGSDMYTKITMMMQSAQTAPDVFTEDGFMINSDAAAGYLEPLDDVVSANSDFANVVPAILAGGKAADGKQYGIPFSTDVQGIWYNKDLMQKAGVAVPFAPKTWADVLDAADKLKAIGGDGFIPVFLFGSKVHPEETSMRTFQELYFGTGGQLYDYDTGKWIVDKANLLKVYNFINDVYNVHKVGAPLSILAQQSVGDLFTSDYMKNGKLGMYFSGSWEAGNWGEGKKYEWQQGLDVWDYAKIPTYDGSAPGYSTMSGGWTWAVPKNATNKEGGKKLLEYLCSKPVQLSYALFSGDLAVRQDVMSDPAYTSQKMSVVNQANEMMQYTHFRPSVEGYASVTTMYTEIVESIAMGSATPDQAVATFESELKRLIGEDKVVVK